MVYWPHCAGTAGHGGKKMTYQQHIRHHRQADVIVIGSGSAGATAAITAARCGRRVILVERYGFMGGTSTQVLDTFYGFYTPGATPHKVVGGIPDQIVAALFAKERAILRPNSYGAGQGITYDPQTLKIVWEQLAIAAGVEVLYHTFVLDARTDAERVVGVIAANKGGLWELRAPVCIDASGDADVVVAAGGGYHGGDDGTALQSLTTTFHMYNVDTAQAKAVSTAHLHTLMAKAIAAGYDLPRREGSVHITPFPGVMVTNMTRVTGINPLDIVALSTAEIAGRQQAELYARFLVEYVPGYAQAFMGQLSHQIGVRESRRIDGVYQLSRHDVLAAADFTDAIARCGAPIEDHHAGADTRWHYLPEGRTYGIPWRSLLPRTRDGIIVAGRCLAADHDAHASVRSMGQCMAMGQAAGLAAHLCVRDGVSPHNLNVPLLQHEIQALGGIV